VRIEVGYGLEDRVPDLVASRIIRDTIAPRLQAGDRDGAVTAGVDALLAAINREGPTAPATTGYERPGARPLTLGQKILFGLIGLFLLWLVITHPALVYYLLVNILSSSGGGGGYRGGGSWGGGGGGGFSGGGGRSGGGGATGSW
jgi:uncharacterized protein